MMRAISRNQPRLLLLATAVLAALLLATPAAAQELYKWQGDDGSTHYSAQPPEDREYQVVDMAAGRLSFVDPADDLVRVEEPEGDDDSDEGDSERRDPEEMSASERAEYCDELDERLRWLVAGRAERLSDVYSEEEVRNPESRGALIEELAADIDESCPDDD